MDLQELNCVCQNLTGALFLVLRICYQNWLVASHLLFSTLAKPTYKPLDDSSKEMLVINTPKGLFSYTRMPYGFFSVP